MIVVQLKGGMSNQLFQYATARRLAHKLKSELRLDLSWFKNIDKDDTPRHFELDAFNIAATPIDYKSLQIKGEGLGKKEKLKRLFSRNKTIELTRFQEKDFRFDKTVLDLTDNTYIEGYFQSEKYFADIRDVILQDLNYKKEPSQANSKLLKDIQASNSVSVHVRRGDYVNNPHANKFHGLIDPEYYNKAVRFISNKIDNPTFYVISNDPAWCKANLRIKGQTVYVDNNDDSNQGSEDMRLMRNCKHNIMANSSFSWWGAWLNENPDKIVIAPKKWFNDKSVDTTDLIPSSWHKI